MLRIHWFQKYATVGSSWSFHLGREEACLFCQVFTSHFIGRSNISVASVCLCVCLSVYALQSEPVDLQFGAHIKDHHISDKFEGQGHRSKVKVTKVKNVKIPVFSLVSENVVQGQGHEGQGHKGQRS